MKALMPWMLVLGYASVSIAQGDEGIIRYREGDYLQAANLLENAKASDPVVQYYLAQMRLYGYGSLRSNDLAIQHFSKAAQQGYLPAQKLMGIYSLLRQKKPEEALAWFKKAAEAKDTQALMYCAAAYLYGLGTKANEDTARKFYIDAARNGDAIAQYALAENFLDSHHSENHKLGQIWLSKALAQGNPKAMLKMAELKLEAKEEGADEEAKRLIQAAADKGYSPAYIALAEAASKANNLTEARDWYLKAANAGNVEAQLALAAILRQANSPIYNANEAIEWLGRAANNQSEEAQSILIAGYEKGDLLQKNDALAAAWKKKLAETKKASAERALSKVALWLSNDSSSDIQSSGYHLTGIFNDWSNKAALREENYNPAPKMDSLKREAIFNPQFVLADPKQVPVQAYYMAIAESLGNTESERLQFPEYPLENPVIEAPVQAALQLSPVIALAEAETEIQLPESMAVESDALPSSSVPAVPSPIRMQSQSSSPASFKAMRIRAIVGDPNAAFAVAQRYARGEGVKADPEEAVYFYQLAADQNELRAKYNLGLMYLLGQGIKANPEKGLAYLNEAAYKGNSYAQYVLARLYEQGYQNAEGEKLVKADPERAMSLYYIAADAKDGLSQYRLADILLKDRSASDNLQERAKRTALIKDLYQGAVKQGIEAAKLPLAFFNAMDKDLALQGQAFEEAKQQAEKGNGVAAFLLGLLYDKGIGTEADHKSALSWYQKAAENPASRFVLGTYLSQGQNSPEALNQAMDMLRQSADSGFAYANLNLAVLKQKKGEAFIEDLNKARALNNTEAGILLADYYLSQNKAQENNGADSNLEQAKEIYQHFAEKGDKLAQFKLAYMNEQGLGAERNYAAAEKWYQAAAKQAEVRAQFSLARLYQLGLVGSEPDYKLAKQWYSVAKAKYAPAAVGLGFIYDTVEDNYSAALEAYKLAAEQGDANGRYDMALVYALGKGTAVDDSKAKELYEEAAKAGNPEAMTRLADFYLQGPEKLRDKDLALNWYQKAAEKSEPEALYQLGNIALEAKEAQGQKTALDYYQRAASLGYQKAKMALGKLNQSLPGASSAQLTLKK